MQLAYIADARIMVKKHDIEKALSCTAVVFWRYER